MATLGRRRRHPTFQASSASTDPPAEKAGQATRYRWDAESQRSAPVKSETIVIETPPSQHRTIENRYVEVETDRYQNAHAWATAEIARKHPGATGFVHQLESLIRQKLAATPQ